MAESRVYTMLWQAAGKTDRFVSSCGGTRSGKTFAALQFLRKLALRSRGLIISVVSETMPHLKRGAIRDFQSIIGNEWDDNAWNKTDCIYTFPTGSIIEFFSADSPAKVHGPARDVLFINEAQNIAYETARQLFVRTRGLVLIDYNPTHSFWLNEKIEAQDNCVVIHSTYKDNCDKDGKSFLTDEQIAEIESNKGDSNWWKVYGEGKVGTLDGLIYGFTLIDRLPEGEGLREVWGIDFGFSHDPTAIVRVLADTGRKIAYVDEVAYRTGMLNADIADILTEQGIPRYVNIWADAAEPKSIAEIGYASGLNIQACDKSAPVRSDRLKFQLQWMQGWDLRITKSSVNLIKEMRNYTWAKDRDGNSTNTPIDMWNHGADAMRYALYSEFGDSASGQYVIGFRNRPHPKDRRYERERNHR